MKPFDPTKPCRTRDGRPAKVLYTQSRCAQPIVAEYQENGGYWDVGNFNADGTFYHDGAQGDNDLINIPEKRKLTGWLNVYDCFGYGMRYETKQECDDNVNNSRTRLACIDLSKYNIEFTEGDGL